MSCHSASQAATPNIPVSSAHVALQPSPPTGGPQHRIDESLKPSRPSHLHTRWKYRTAPDKQGLMKRKCCQPPFFLFRHSTQKRAPSVSSFVTGNSTQSVYTTMQKAYESTQSRRDETTEPSDVDKGHKLSVGD